MLRVRAVEQLPDLLREGRRGVGAEHRRDGAAEVARRRLLRGRVEVISGVGLRLRRAGVLVEDVEKAHGDSV